MKNIGKISLWLFLVFLSVKGMTQPDLPSEEVQVIQDFEARLADSEKLTLQPELPAAEDGDKELEYQISVKTLQMEYLPPKLRPLAIRTPKPSPGYKGYFKGGYGIPNASLGEFSYHFIDNNQYILGIKLNHQAANNKVLEHQRFMDNSGQINGTYYLDNGLAVGGHFGIDNQQLHFYGYDHTTQIFDRPDVRQKFNNIYGRAYLFNGERNYGDINYKATFDVYHLTDKYTAKETGFKTRLHATKWFAEKHPLTVDLIADLTNPSNILTNRINTYHILPNFTWHADRFRFKAGVNMAFYKDDFFIFPDAEVAANIIGTKLAAYLGAKGDLQKNTMLSLSEYNEWIATQNLLSLQNSSYFHFYGGVKGNLTLVDYQIEGGFKPTKDLPMFLNVSNSTDDSLRFFVLYDTVDIYNITGSLTANPIKNLSVTASLGQNYFRPKHEAKAWHLPSFSMDISARYMLLSDKLMLKAEFFFENGVPYKVRGNDEIQHLNGLYDFNIGAEYRLFKYMGLFVDFNNLADNKRRRWHRYPNYGFNLIGGVTARF